LPRSFPKSNKINNFSLARGRCVYQSCVPKSSDFRPSPHQIRGADLNGRL
jgi:hypothetical protein